MIPTGRHAKRVFQYILRPQLTSKIRLQWLSGGRSKKKNEAHKHNTPMEYMKTLYKKVHPDLFGNPELEQYKGTNEESLARLNSLVDFAEILRSSRDVRKNSKAGLANKPPPPQQLEFYCLEVLSASASEAAYVPFDDSDRDVRKVVVNFNPSKELISRAAVDPRPFSAYLDHVLGSLLCDAGVDVPKSVTQTWERRWLRHSKKAVGGRDIGNLWMNDGDDDDNETGRLRNYRHGFRSHRHHRNKYDEFKGGRTRQEQRTRLVNHVRGSAIAFPNLHHFPHLSNAARKNLGRYMQEHNLFAYSKDLQQSEKVRATQRFCHILEKKYGALRAREWGGRKVGVLFTSSATGYHPPLSFQDIIYWCIPWNFGPTALTKYIDEFIRDVLKDREVDPAMSSEKERDLTGIQTMVKKVKIVQESFKEEEAQLRREREEETSL